MAHQVKQAIEGTSLQRKFLVLASQYPVDIVNPKNIKFVDHGASPISLSADQDGISPQSGLTRETDR